MICLKDSINRYFNDLDFRYTVYSNMLHIINYNKILSLEDNRISILYNNKRIIFKGNNFILKKMLDNEVLIRGVVLGVEVNDI